MVKNLPAYEGDVSSVHGLGSVPRGGHGNPLQYSCLGNPMDRGARRATVHGVTESDMTEKINTQMHTHTYIHMRLFLNRMRVSPMHYNPLS